MRTPAPLLLPLFRSAGQAAVLAEVYLSTEELSAADVAQRTGVSYPTARREVRELVEAGLLTQHRVGATQLLSPAQSSPYFRPLHDLLELAFGAVSLLRGAFEHIDGIEMAAVFGSYAERAAGTPGPPPADIDVLVVGTPDVAEIYAACTEVAGRAGREVNPTVWTAAEWRSPDPFVTGVRQGALLPVIGDPCDRGGADGSTAGAAA